MTPEGRRAIATWLRRHAAFLVKHGDSFSPRFTGRFLYVVVAAAALALVTPAGAKDVTVTLNDEEQKALWVVFDAALKAKGMELGGNVVFLWQKLQAAAEGPKPAATPAPDPKGKGGK